ncbi:hypothetical protein C834K_0371 [Chlamydia poikilotherma]|uniref:Sperm tail-specific-like protein n=1 Tax=Chlamydia poikilotherma TaxID=1967783 RepID=A0A3B0QFS3_9CHLA|nr:hypothetical protein [Chlamydia poikilotherma]SYX08834.1 hypothetical protein C834K_0371 [Chlamydia poikilotherma]
MMSSKRTSQLAMLSVLLTFTHSVGYASAAVAPFEVSSVYSEDSLIALESKKSKKERRIQKIQENRRARQEAKKAAEAKKNAKAVDKKSNKVSFGFKGKFNQDRQEQQHAFPKNIKQGIEYCCEELVQYGRVNLLTRGGKYSKRYNKSNDCGKNTILNEQSVKTTPRLSAREKAKIRKRGGTIVRAAPNTESPRSLLKTMVVSGEVKVASENEEKVQVVHDIKEGPVLPIFVRPDAKVVSHEERSKLIQDLAREQRVAKRKSSREALEAHVKESKIPRDGKITSTLRYDVEKAAAVKVRRNASVNPQVRAQKASNNRRDARNGQNQQESAQNVKRGSPDQQEQIANNTPTDDFYSVSSAAGNTNVNSYLNAKQYRCDSSETDWPCSSCVAKRRTHTSISVCTMVVTVIAMIVGAIIIANASDSGTTPPNPTPPSPQPNP